jgi:O-antigen ligase
MALSRIKKWKINKKNFTEGLCLFLIAMMFISKISLKWTGVVPRTLSPFIFQHGLHPFMNFGINFLGGFILLYIYFRKKERPKVSPTYKFLIFSMIGILSIQTLFQIAVVNITYSVIMQLGGLIMAIAVTTIFGVFIPALLPIDRMVHFTKRFVVILVFASLILLPALSPFMFRGGRFIGVFKHIPHMVSAATFAFIYFLPSVFNYRSFTWKKNNILNILALILIFFAVILTATKAALITCLIAVVGAILIYGSKKRSVRMFKFFFIGSILTFIFTVGPSVANFAYDVATGQKGFGMRPAQDGIESRMEEIHRGWGLFQESPAFGRGILYKFMNAEGVNVSGYNSFKDPHNLFVSAGVIAGWPFLIFSVIAYLAMVAGTIKGLASKNMNHQMLALFLLSHLPVFLIYHVHISLGGMGDRMYWLVFGYLALTHKKSVYLTT